MKKLNLIYCFIFLATLLSCSVEDTGEENSGISNTPLKAFINNKSYDFVEVNVKPTTLFDDAGFMFYLNTKDMDCSSSNYDLNVDSKFDFFIKTSKLAVGKFTAKGPFIQDGNNSISFLGSDVEITEVTDTMIKGKVFGGKKSDGTYFEGAFTANLCAAEAP